MPMRFDMGPLAMLVRGADNCLVVENLQDLVPYKALQRLVIDIGVGNLALLAGAEMEYLAAGKGNPDGCMASVSDGLHDGTSWM